jgi:hypothetical protein
MSLSTRCEFETCQRRGKERVITYYAESDKPKILRPTVCDEHYHAMIDEDGAERAWLKTL